MSNYANSYYKFKCWSLQSGSIISNLVNCTNCRSSQSCEIVQTRSQEAVGFCDSSSTKHYNTPRTLFNCLSWTLSKTAASSLSPSISGGHLVLCTCCTNYCFILRISSKGISHFSSFWAVVVKHVRPQWESKTLQKNTY